MKKILKDREIRIMHSENEWVLFFILDYGYCFFLPIRHLSHHLPFIFFLLSFIDLCIYGVGVFR